MKTVTIRLAGLLQSYGSEANFNYRTTLGYPSKSAVIGMIAAAFGYERDNPAINRLNNLAFAVRIDQPGRALQDFQMVHMQKGKQIQSKITYRDYLQDAVFVVAIGSEDSELIEKIQYSLRHPRFSLFLGRRANVPGGMLQTKVYEDTTPINILDSLQWQAAKWFQKKQKKQDKVQVDIVSDANLLPDQRYYLQKDKVVSFSQKSRQFEFRRIAEKSIELINPQFEKLSWDTEHDIMNFL